MINTAKDADIPLLSPQPSANCLASLSKKRVLCIMVLFKTGKIFVTLDSGDSLSHLVTKKRTFQKDW